MSSDEESEEFEQQPELPKCVEELFHNAVYEGDEAEVRKFLDKGVDVNWTDCMGWGALHLACRQKHSAICRLLIARGADIRLKGLNNWTPLHYAAHADDQELVKEMIDLGADKMALTIDNRTPRDLAIKWACKQMFYSRPEYEIEYERWLYPEKYEAEVKAKEEADKKKWEEIKARMEQRRKDDDEDDEDDHEDM